MRDALNSGDHEEMKAAVRLNWRLWTIFQAELLSPNCEIPMAIRQNILSLANFIDGHSVNFMSDPVAKDMDVLININREIAGGLHDGAKHAEQNAHAPVPSENAQNMTGEDNPQEAEAQAPKIDLSDLEV